MRRISEFIVSFSTRTSSPSLLHTILLELQHAGMRLECWIGRVDSRSCIHWVEETKGKVVLKCKALELCGICSEAWLIDLGK